MIGARVATLSLDAVAVKDAHAKTWSLASHVECAERQDGVP